MVLQTMVLLVEMIEKLRRMAKANLKIGDLLPTWTLMLSPLGL